MQLSSKIKAATIFLLVFVIEFFSTTRVFAAATTITSFTPASTTIGRYQKFEATFQISRTFPAADYSNNTPSMDSLMPYYPFEDDANGITINGHFLPPGCTQTGCEKVVPAFYYQQYSGSGQSLSTNNTYSWKLRFAPSEIGTYNYFVTILDKNGSSRYPTNGNLSFTSSSLTSNPKGFIRVSSVDPRFMKFDNGESFIPLGAGHQWWKPSSGRSADFENTFNSFGTNGINFVRIWDQNDGYALTTEGHFDQFKYPDDFNAQDRGLNIASFTKGTQMNQRGNYEEDRIIEAAEKNGVYIQLCSHASPFWIWPYTTHPSNEDPGSTQVAADDDRYIAAWKRNYRYRIARFGYSTSVLAWEVWNEEGHILSGTTTWNFYKKLAAYVKTTDPFAHLFTTSQGSQTFSPGMWSSSDIGFDLANYHDYMMPGRYASDLVNDEVNFVAKFSWCLGTKGRYCSGLGVGDGSSWSGAYKPWVWGEIDVGTANWNEPNTDILTKSARVKMLHNTTWIGLFSPMGVSPLDWYWDRELESGTTDATYADRKATRAFFNGIDYTDANFIFMISQNDRPSGYADDTTLTVSNTTARAYGMRRFDKNAAYIWVQNRNNVWSKPMPAAISTNVTIGGLVSGASYSVEVWKTDTIISQIVSTSTQTATSGNITVSLSNLATDQAVKIISGANAPTSTPTPYIGNGDANGDGKVDLADINYVIINFFKKVLPPLDQNGDGVVNTMDFAMVAAKIKIAATATPTVAPTSSPGNATDEWTEFGHDAQRSNFTLQTVATPWKYMWQWNGAGNDGKKQSGHVSVPDLVQPITGGGRIYMTTTSSGVYAFNKTGGTLWNNSSLGTLNSSPAYANEFLFVASTNGKLYKLNAADGREIASFTAPAALNTAPLLLGNRIYVASGNNLIAVNTDSMSQVWSYAAGSTLVTPPTYSSGKNLLVVNSQDLYVHAINVADGTRKWRVKPTPNSYAANSVEFDNGWPVVAEQHGIIFVRYRLVWDTLWTWNPYPITNAQIKNNLQGKPDDQTLFAMNLDNGLPAWPVSGKNPSWSDASSYIPPAVGNGGAGDGGTLPMGPMPVVATTSDGKEVAYIIWRNGLTCGGCATGGSCNGQWCDGREDATMGEMVLDGNTVSGYQAGDVRFVKYADIQTDEMMNLTMSKDTIFHSHWLVNEAARITDRSSNLGATFASPINTVNAPFVIWRQCSCAGGTPGCSTVCNYPGCTSAPTCQSTCQFNAQTRSCPNELYSYGDSRSYPPGFYEYMNDSNGGSSPYTVVSANQVLVKTLDGALMVFESGNPTAQTNTLMANINSLINSFLIKFKNQSPAPGVSAASPPAIINYTNAGAYINKYVTVSGTIRSIVNHLPKAIYLGFTDPHDGHLLLRIFGKDLSKFPYDPLTLLGKSIKVSGKVTLYWPENKDPEIIVTDPAQIQTE